MNEWMNEVECYFHSEHFDASRTFAEWTKHNELLYAYISLFIWLYTEYS